MKASDIIEDQRLAATMDPGVRDVIASAARAAQESRHSVATTWEATVFTVSASGDLLVEPGGDDGALGRLALSLGEAREYLLPNRLLERLEWSEPLPDVESRWTPQRTLHVLASNARTATRVGGLVLIAINAIVLRPWLGTDPSQRHSFPVINAVLVILGLTMFVLPRALRSAARPDRVIACFLASTDDAAAQLVTRGPHEAGIPCVELLATDGLAALAALESILTAIDATSAIHTPEPPDMLQRAERVDRGLSECARS